MERRPYCGYTVPVPPEARRLDPRQKEACTSRFIATDPIGYERYVGRWSRRLAPLFAEFAGVGAGERVLDVGCGTGDLILTLAAANVAAAIGIDVAAPYIAYARRRTTDRTVTFEVGDALDLPYVDGVFDRALSMLALDVMADPGRALAEMRRVTRPGGVLAALVNDFRCGYAPFAMLLDTAAALDPRAGAVRDTLVSEPMRWPGGLAARFRAVELANVTERRLSVLYEFTSFADYWSSFLAGQGTLGGYVMSLAERQRTELERHVRAAYLCGMRDGPRAFTTWFWAVRGRVPDARGATDGACSTSAEASAAVAMRL
ncbi:MAG TPA: methyltransferase domain-containing protein [Methylomirabilota bacterium]|nr:methyltransferase domain-containing protein [Methylomirabilota bacterium]